MQVEGQITVPRPHYFLQVAVLRQAFWVKCPLSHPRTCSTGT